ncbi:MAG: NHLP family bacteriocin export ABC transporter peptidase/permease/ATPase subunit [Leptolyngbyaceae cyanobacterium bins.59]|nr:NHLP family bacteriocin export ABC transporter peptidase/permease/ATPase subunit [Leptolyngbyaceae cyanobacterium bins.59]
MKFVLRPNLLTQLRIALKNLSPQKARRVRTPTVLQMEAVECGAASLAIVLGYYGRIVPLPELRQTCGVSRDGSNAANLVKAARRYGLVAKGFKKSLDALRSLRCPYIIFWNFNHFLVVEGWSRHGVFLNDPLTGPRMVSYEEFNESYTGIALVMEPGPEFRRGGHRPNVVPALVKRLRGVGGALTFCLLLGFLLLIPGLAVPALTQVFVDRILVQGQADGIRPLLLGMGLMVMLRGGLTWLQLRYLSRIRIKLAVKLSSQFLWHVLRLPIRFYLQRFPGEIAHRINLNNRLSDVLSGQLATTVIDLTIVLFYGIIMIQYDPLLTAMGTVFAAINLVVLHAISRQSVDANTRLGMEYGKLAGVAISGLQSIETLKSSALESDFFARWSGYYTKAIAVEQGLRLKNQLLNLLPPLLSGIITVLLLVVGGYRVIEGKLTLGMLVAFQSLMLSFLEPVNRLVNFGNTLQEVEGGLERLEDVLNNPVDPQLIATTSWNFPGVEVHRLQGRVELRDLTFGYSPIDPPLIENFNLTIQPGQRVALVGGSGSGKSTLLKLLTGLYQPWSGGIYFDDRLLPQIPRAILTHSLAVVEQDIWLFGGTIRDNLTLWDSTIPENHLIRACQDAAIHDVILTLPGGYGAMLLEGGVNLSGGQRQRLEIARALVHHPSILVLDEATSALDTETEQFINQNLRRRGCTCILVTHRLSAIRGCDEIIVLERGKVVERGTHETLYPQQRAYFHLIESEGWGGL